MFWRNNFRTAVKRYFDFLTDRGYEVVEEEVSKAFDNGFVTYQSPALKIQVVRDRGYVRYDVSTVDEYLCDDDIIHSLVKDTVYIDRAVESEPVPYKAGYLCGNLKKITDLFSPERLTDTKSRICVLRAQRGRGW